MPPRLSLIEIACVRRVLALVEPQNNTLPQIPYQPLTLPSHVQFYGSTRGTFAEDDRVWVQSLDRIHDAHNPIPPTGYC